jgi:hypothetical protein
METKFEIVLNRLIKAESEKEVLIVRNNSLEHINESLKADNISLRLTNELNKL